MSTKKKFEYTKQDIVNLILQDIQQRHGETLTAEEVRSFTNQDGDMLVVPNDSYESVPPYYDTSEHHEIQELLQWAVENNEMIEIVYVKRGRNNERTARIITPLHLDGEYLRTLLHVTVRGTELEYSDSDDNKRTFIMGLIERARLSRL